MWLSVWVQILYQIQGNVASEIEHLILEDYSEMSLGSVADMTYLGCAMVSLSEYIGCKICEFNEERMDTVHEGSAETMSNCTLLSVCSTSWRRDSDIDERRMSAEVARASVTMEELAVHEIHARVRGHAAAVLAGLMKGKDGELSKEFRERAYSTATKLQKRRKHSRVLALAACVLLVPYDMPSWLPEHATLLAHFVGEPSTVNSIVTKSFAEFCRTYADTWSIQKDLFTEEQLEVLGDTSTKVISAKYLIKTDDDAFVHVDEV
ncbi:proteasome activator subunit 4 [Tanacetum coccineum]